AHLYERPRTWLEGFYGSGWGTSSADVVDATWRNFAMGHNLLTLHGLYYSTHGGWWEWAPPCNHFRMPYWANMGEFLRASERLSYLLSQGRHRADVAILYPVAAVEAGLSGKEAVSAAFSLGEHLYGKGIDFDFMDFESLARSQAKGGELQVAGESYRVLVLPSMRAVRHSTLERARDFARSGGIVVALGALPEASDRTGSGDPNVGAIVEELFAATGKGRHLSTAAEVESLISASFPRDIDCAAGHPYVQHRRIGPRDVYMIYGVPKDTACTFRATGKVEFWNPWTGGTEDAAVLSQSGESTRLSLPLSETEAQLIVFSPGRARTAPPVDAPLARRGLDGDWEFELSPTLDNRFGDYRLPASNTFIGAEVRRLRYLQTTPEESLEAPSIDDSAWPLQTYTYGPRFRSVDFSWRWGVENDPGHQGYHGLKAEMPRDLFAFGKPIAKSTEFVYEAEPGVSSYELSTTVLAPHAMQSRVESGGVLPASALVNGQPAGATVPLHAGANTLLLRYDKPGRAHYVL
ncbi:MAG: glycosyl hydrolase, partial [Acidobacteria bacterium]|nr:glycosyl hydrolase [Acidobacteriota bacterium]